MNKESRHEVYSIVVSEGVRVECDPIFICGPLPEVGSVIKISKYMDFKISPEMLGDWTFGGTNNGKIILERKTK